MICHIDKIQVEVEVSAKYNTYRHTQ